MKRFTIAPQHLVVAAPLPLVFDLLGSLQYGCRTDAGLHVSLIGHEGPRMLVSFSTRHDQGRRPTIKELTLESPCWAMYRDLSGPFAGTTEQIELRSSGAGTVLLLSAAFNAPDDESVGRRKMQLEQSTQIHLEELKLAAEERVRMPQAATGHTVPVPLPVLASEAALLAAIESQEETEWGHVGHGRGVARVAVSLAEAALLPARQVESIQRAALLHDAGKLALDSELWAMRGTLSPDQRAWMEAHPRLGHDLASRVGLPDLVLTGILHHHERWDGHGYPDGLRGEQIPLKGRILFLAEAIDSMLRANYRRQALSPEEVIAFLEADSGRRWDPMLVRKATQIMRGR